MATEGVTSFKTGVRVALGPAQTDTKAQVTEEHVSRLLEQAKAHPGFQAHSERYEFRMRTLNGQAVLELKEKNWASSFKSLFTGTRKSDERKAAGEALGQMFQIPKFFKGTERVNSAKAREFASTITTRVDQFLKDKAEGNVSLDKRSDESWAQGLQTTREKVADQAADDPVDTESGLFKKTLNEVHRMRLENAASGFTLVMGTSADAGQHPLQGLDAVKAGFDMTRRKTGFSDHVVGDQGFALAKRNLMSVLRSGFQQEWLTNASDRCEQKYGMGATLNGGIPQKTEFHIDSAKRGDVDVAVVTLRTAGGLDIGGMPTGWSADRPPAMATMDFSAEVTIEVPWNELASDTFQFDPAHVKKSEEHFGLKHRAAPAADNRLIDE